MLPFFRQLGSADLYKVDDVQVVEGKITTRGGNVLTPVPPPPEPLPTQPPIEPTPLPIFRPDQ